MLVLTLGVMSVALLLVALPLLSGVSKRLNPVVPAKCTVAIGALFRRGFEEGLR